MPLDTAVPGRPEDVHGLATWVRSTLGIQLGATAGQLNSATRTAATGWLGASGEAFRTRMDRGARGTDELATTAADSARALDDFAVGLQRTQADMNEVRLTAAAAGLAVDGDLILEPGAAPPPPGPPPVGPAATPEAVAAHADATSAVGRWQELDAAYRRAGEAALALRRHQNTLVVSALQNAYDDVTKKWFLSAGDMVGAGAGGLATYQAHALSTEAARLRELADTTRARATSAPPGTSRNTIFRDLDEATEFGRRADDLAGRSTRLSKAADAWGLRAGGALAVAGVVYDIVATDKPVDQAIVSGTVGFAASVGAGMATGAVVGSFIPFPVVGTVAGAVIGAAAGLFASGAVDALYEHGIGAVGQAWDAGLDAVTETGAAIGGLAEDAWDAIF